MERKKILIKRLAGLRCNLNHFFVFCRTEIFKIIVNRINIYTIQFDLVMKMIGNRHSCTPYKTDNVSSLYLLAYPYIEIAKMRIDTGIAETMINYYMFAKTSLGR
jgi:hypothetical protein